MFRSREQPEKLTTDFLIKKFALLVLLASGQRPQALIALKLSNMSEGTDTVTFTLKPKDVKQGRPGYLPPNIILHRYEEQKL